MLKKLKTHFFSGLLILGPVFLTTIFIGYLVRITDQFIVNPVFRILPWDIEVNFKIFITKVAIGIVVFFSVCIVGFLAERFIFRRVFLGWETFLQSIPFFNKIYSSIKDIIKAFFGDKSQVYKKVVFIEYPRKGIYSMGFVMAERRWEIHQKTNKEMVTVLVPSPPNPATGYFCFVPKEEVIEASMTIEEGIRLVISGGAAIPRLKE